MADNNKYLPGASHHARTTQIKTLTRESAFTARPDLTNLVPASGLGVRKEEVELRLKLLL